MSTAPRTPTDDDLFAPSLGAREGRPTGWRRPWRLGSQVYVAFFGGAIAVTPIAAFNAYKLGLERAKIIAIVAIGIFTLIASVAVAVTLDTTSSVPPRAVALVGWGGMWLIQRQADRAYQWHHDEDEWEPLWGPGIIAVIAGFVVQATLIVAAVEASE